MRVCYDLCMTLILTEESSCHRMKYRVHLGNGGSIYWAMWPFVGLLGLSRIQAVIYARRDQRQSVGSTTVTEF